MNASAKNLLIRGAAELGLQLGAAELGELDVFAGELKKWSKKINLTAIKNDEEIAVKHFVDSLTLAKVVKGKGRLLDIGSGGGFPAIPLKIAMPELDIVSVDAVEKKLLFQRHVARLLRLQGFEAVHARAEGLAAAHAGSFDWAVSRAFSDIATFATLALPLLKPDGYMVAMKGKNGREEVNAALTRLDLLGIEVSAILEFDLPVSGDGRSLVIMAKRDQNQGSSL